MKNENMDSKDVLQMLQQKIGNIELTLHAMLQALQNEDVIDQEQVNEEAQKIVQEMQQEISKEEIDLSTGKDE